MENNNIKNNNLIGIAAIILAVSIGYYFGIFLPSKSVNEQLSKNQIDCSQTQKNVYQNYISTNDVSKSTLDSNNHYNQKLNECIVEVSDMSCGKVCTSDLTIFNGIENKAVAYCVTPLGNNLINGPTCEDFSKNPQGDFITKDQFNQLENQYMSQ